MDLLFIQIGYAVYFLQIMIMINSRMITPRTPPRAGPMVLQSTKQHSQSVNDMILIFQINSIIKYANKISALQETRSLGGLPHSNYGEIIRIWYLPVVKPMVVD